MKSSLLLIVLSLCATTVSADVTPFPASQADSLWLHAYTTPRDNYHTGLHFEWSLDSINWFTIGREHAFVKSDYGNWGSQKRMLNPRLIRFVDGTWQLRFNVGETDPHIGLCVSRDLVHWTAQDYYLPKDLTEAHNGVEDTVFYVEQKVIRTLEAEVLRAEAAALRNAERAIDDPTRFNGLSGLNTHIVINDQHTRQISDKLMGIFFEDISYSADGGLYAEMIQNRDFEYTPMDQRNRDASWNATKCWTAQGANLQIDTANPLHKNNPHHAVLRVKGQPVTLCNEGWDGIPVRSGAKYNLSIQLRPEALDPMTRLQVKAITATLRDKEGNVLAQGRLSGGKHGEWKQLKCQLKATGDCDTAHLELSFEGQAEYHLDMISLFPQDTYKNRPNGMRRDLAEALEALHPRFVRFPGGCVAHGDGLDNLYRWKNTIGPLEARKPNWNLWRYHQTVGLGYYEYFQFCEDLGAEPLPVLAAGVPCQNSCVGEPGNEYGQQGGIPLGPEMDEYIQDVLDLVEWANGDPKTSRWAKMRADAGHPKPFNLKMIGIGNEDLISRAFEERFRLIYDVVRARYPEIEVVGTVGPFYEGSDYEQGWRIAREHNVPIVDEHYYNTPGWFINNQHFYDSYQRGGTKVYLGEYAAHIPGRANNIETALAEALHLCNVERNGDVVEMTSYAPLLARKGYTRWNPDLIYFDGTSLSPTTGYEVQRLFGVHTGTTWYPAKTQVNFAKPTQRNAPRPSTFDVQKRIASSCLRDEKSGDYILKVVNYLPVSNDVTLSLPFLDAPVLVSAEHLSGALDALEVKTQPKDGVTLSGSKVKATLAPYSLTVIRIHP